MPLLSEIWLADAVRALHDLGEPGSPEVAGALRVLGLTGSAVPRPVPGTTAPEGATPTAPGTSLPAADDPPSPVTKPPAPRARREASTPRRARRPSSAPLRDGPQQIVAYEPPSLSISRLEPLARTATGSGRIPFEPLLAPSTARSVLQLLLSQRTATGPVDVQALVRATATQQLRAVPRDRVRALSRHVQVMVDCGDRMEIFARDQADVVERVELLFGPDQLEVLYFADAPLRGCGADAIWTWEAYPLPPPHSTVLLLSDLGINDGLLSSATSTRAEWEDFAALLSLQQCTVVALGPWPVRHLPPWVGRLFSPVTWDRSTTAPKAGTVTS